MADEIKKANEALEDQLPDTWVFTVNTKTNQVMLVGPKRQVRSDEVTEVIVAMVVLLGRLGDMITQEVKAPQGVYVAPKGQHRDN